LDGRCATYVGDPDNPTASAFYHADDAAGTIRNTTGIYLILPDERGYFLRGLDTSGTIDPQGATRDIGDTQDDDIEAHKHDISEYTPSQTKLFGNDAAGYSGGTGFTALDSAFPVEVVADSIISPSGNHDETRAKNSACRWCIRF
jgi:hypothetical protein